MVKIAMTSDNHFDINKINATEMMKLQAEYLVRNQVDWYLIAGDLFNNFEQSLKYVHALQSELGTETKVQFIAGNHDMLHGVAFEELEGLKDDNYAHNRQIDIPDTNWTLIGNNGWYDYSYRDAGVEIEEAESWKRAYWVDSIIKQPMSDIERMQIVLLQTKNLIEQNKNRKIVYFTHFVPKENYIIHRPEVRMWNMANAMMGSLRLGRYLEQQNIEMVLFGHLHIHPEPQQINQTTYFNQSVGYKQKHVNEWIEGNFFDQWRARLKIIELN